MIGRLTALAASTASLLALGAALTASPAMAHPLGNFTTNQFAQVRIDEGRARVHYVLDQAEIPTFQQIQRFDASGNGTIEGAERGPLLDSQLAEISSGLELTANGRPLRLGPPHDPKLSFPSGQGGLLLTRVEADLSARLPRGARRVELVNRAFAGRIGWRAIQILPGSGTDVTSTVPATDPTDALRSYPQDLLSSPPDDLAASFEVRLGSGAVTAPPGLAGDESGEDRALDGFANSLAGGDSHGLLILFLLAAAFGWGALHALSPGHGKAMVAGYLVGSRGTPRHALILGLTVTVTHTASVFALGLVTLAASEYVLPEDLYPWLGIASGLMVVSIGFTIMRSRLRRWRSLRELEVERAPTPGHRGQGHAHSHGHSHGHGQPLTMRGLIGLGISGGLVPCPSALVVLIAAISQHRVGLGMVLILAFSLGLAATLTAVGLAVIWGGRALERLRLERRVFGGRLAGALPAVSASVIVLAGTLITLRAIPELGG
ncbi:MAG: sulfite exporter TauE/SafE family protein [Actinomycetota bacterium]